MQRSTIPPLAETQPAPALPLAPARGSPWVLPTVGGLLIAMALVAFIARRRRRRGEDEGAVEAVAVPRASPVSPAPVPSTATRARLALSFVPRRAGVNLLTATLDAQVIVRNDGDAPARDVRVDLRLLGAGSGQAETIARLFSAAAIRAVAPPFSLAPGEERAVTAIATLPRAEIEAVTMGDRPMFVPLAAIDVRYRTGEIDGQTAQVFALGIEREGAAKLAPFRLDGPGRMHDTIGSRPHGPMVGK